MTIEHTEGDLTYRGTLLYFANNKGGFDLRHAPAPEANARRIVACWNACNGITTESLEENGAAGYEHTVALTKQLAEVRMVLLSTKLEWAQLWAAMDALPDDWIRTTDSMYQNMLEVLPPRAQAGARFLVGEAKTHNAEGKAVYACFKKDGDSYFAKHMTVEQFKAL